MKTTVMYKLVNQDMTTLGGMKWEIGKTNRATKPGKKMCTGQVLHCYLHPVLAILFNPIHGNIPNPFLLKIHCSPVVNSDGLKYATKEQTPVEFVSLPVLTTTQRVVFAIKVALTVYKNQKFVQWAEKWLSGKDRLATSAMGAAVHASRAAVPAAHAAAYAAVHAARAATYAATYVAEDASRAAVHAALAAENVATYVDANAANTLFLETINWVLENIK